MALDPIIRPFVGFAFKDRITGRDFYLHAHNDIVRITMMQGDSGPVEIFRAGKDGVLKFMSTAGQGVDSLILDNTRADSQSSIIMLTDLVNWVIGACGSENPITFGGDPVANSFIIVQKASTAGPSRFALVITPDGEWRVTAPAGVKTNSGAAFKGYLRQVENINFPSTNPGQIQLVTRAMDGVRPGDAVSVTPSDWETGTVAAACYADDVITVGFRNPDSVAHDPSARDFTIVATQFIE